MHKIHVNAESNYANSNGKQMTELFKKVSTNSFPVRNMGLRRSSPIALSSLLPLISFTLQVKMGQRSDKGGRDITFEDL